MLPITFAILAMHAPVPKPTEPVVIDLSDCYSNIKFKKLKYIPDCPEAKSPSTPDIVEAARRAGASSAFLVAGDTIAEALAATNDVYGGGGAVDEVVRPDGKNAKPIWVCVFLGNNATVPPAFEIKQIEIDSSTIKISYCKTESNESSLDVVPYFVWANLGKLGNGTYKVELIDKTRKEELSTSRQVVIKSVRK